MNFLLVLKPSEWRVALRQFKGKDTKRPDVDSLWVASPSFEHFRGHPVERAYSCLPHLLFLHQLHCKPKITQLDLPFFSKKNVVRLDITVNNPFTMEKIKAFKHFVANVLEDVLLLSFEVCTLDQGLHTAFHEREDYPEAVHVVKEILDR